ncbi:MAG: rod shape-determining protein MreC [Acidimicrobiales bacterium]|nr:rod shape-determining protein MreC [Acidimicrobiales bacterium]
MAVSRRAGRSRLTIVLLVLISITALTLDYRGSGVVEGARDLTLDVLAPLKSAAHWVVTPFANVWNGVANYGDLTTENDRLRQQLDDARGEVARAADAEADRRELLALQDLPYVGDIPAVSARVTSAPPTNFDLTVVIDRGSADGIREGMPVVTGAGLVGRVVRVSRSQSVVRLITDSTSAVGVVLTRTRDTGVAHGNGRGEPLTVDLIDPDTSVLEGEFVKTSGLQESTFPPGIPVGRVRTASAGPDAIQQDVEVDPMVDFDRLAYVKVLLWEAPALLAPTGTEAPAGGETPATTAPVATEPIAPTTAQP